MIRFRSKAIAKIKPWLRPALRMTIGRLPRSKARLSGLPAKEGGSPVRNTRYRPWITGNDGSFWKWNRGGRAALRRVFMSGLEGLPQTLSREFAQKWASY